jgi:hypothetical protein
MESEDSIRSLAGSPGGEEAMPVLAVLADAEERRATERWALVDYEALLDMILATEVVVAW